MSVMFANRGQPAAGTGHLMEFKAGRTLIEQGSTPEKRKAVASAVLGVVYIKKSQDDQLLHFCWKNTQSNTTEIDLIIFPNEAEFVRIKECKDGRVYMLKFKNSQERHLFWMQDPTDEKDEEVRKKVNELLSNAQPSSRAPGRIERANPLAGLAAFPSFGGGLEDIGPIGNMDQNQLMRLFSMMNGGGSTAEMLPQLAAAQGQKPEGAVTTSTGSVPSLTRRTQQETEGKGSKESTPTQDKEQGINAQMLSKIISALPVNQQKRQIELSTILTKANTQQVLEKYKQQLIPHVPDQGELQNKDQELSQTVGNPQFRQASNFFGQAFQLGQLGTVLDQFGMDKEVVDASKKGDLSQFAEKLTAQEDPDHAKVERMIEEAADAEENAASAAAKEANEKKDANKKSDKKDPPKPDDDDKMDTA